MKREQLKNEVVTGTEVCEMFGISRATLSRWVERGKLKPVNFNPHLDRQRRFEFHRSDVEALLGKSPTPPPSSAAS